MGKQRTAQLDPELERTEGALFIACSEIRSNGKWRTNYMGWHILGASYQTDKLSPPPEYLLHQTNQVEGVISESRYVRVPLTCLAAVQ